MPTMLIYAKIAAEYSISEDRVRQIIRSKDPPCPSLKGREKKTLYISLKRLCSKRAVELATTQALFSRRGRLRTRTCPGVIPAA